MDDAINLSGNEMVPRPATACNPFQYDQLQHQDSIRILRISSGDSTSEGGLRIQCSLQEVRLRDKPSYSALSYTWGDTSNPSTIFYSTDISFQSESISGLL
jgi:hypothetical protein